MRHRHRVRKRYDRDVTDDIGAPRRRMCANSEPLEQPPCRSLAQQAATAVATAATVDRLGAESAASLLNSWTLRDVCTLSAEPTFGTALWVWGANRDGELGINDFADRPTPELNIWCTGRKMRSAACGRMCTFVDADGVLLACGYTAVMDKDGICVDPQLPMFTPHAATAGRRVLSVRCSGSRVYVVLDTAMLASFETRDTEFRLLHAVRCPLRDGIGSVAFGKRRSFAIRSTGELMEWGPIVPEIMPGSVVDGDDGVCLDTALPFGVARIAAGTRHVAAITRDGTLMTWSEPISKWAYFCGPVAPPPPLHIAVEFPLLHTTTVTEVACGKEHTLALSSTGTVYAWGSNEFAQLGIGVTWNPHLQTPQCVAIPDSSSVRSVHCGKTSSGVILRSDRLFVWGRVVLNTTFEAPMTPPGLERERVHCVAMGSRHMVIITY